MRFTLLSSTIMVMLTFGAPAGAESLRCGGELISVGDTEAELRARCGDPDHVSLLDEISSEATVHPGETLRTHEVIETWVYAGGPGELMRVVELRRGRVAAIESPGKLSEDRGCERAIFRRGARAGQVYLACGEPNDRHRWVEERVWKRGDRELVRVVTRERWTYVPGPNRLMRVLEFADGRLAAVDTGSRGF